MEKHFVKVVTEGDPFKPNYRIWGFTDDGRKYLINVQDLYLSGTREQFLKQIERAKECEML